MLIFVAVRTAWLTINHGDFRLSRDRLLTGRTLEGGEKKKTEGSFQISWVSERTSKTCRVIRGSTEGDASWCDHRSAFSTAFARKTSFVACRTQVVVVERIKLWCDWLLTIDASETVGLQKKKRNSVEEELSLFSLLLFLQRLFDQPTWYCLPSNSVIPRLMSGYN